MWCWGLSLPQGSGKLYPVRVANQEQAEAHWTSRTSIVAGMRKGPTFVGLGLLDLSGRLPTLPHTCACSTIGAEGLNFRVRDGNGWDPLAMVTQHLVASSTEADATELVLLSLCCQELLAEYLNNRIFDGIRLPRLSVMLSAS